MNLKYPVKHIGITQNYNVITHPALDLGWYLTPNDPIFACGDGTVTKVYYFAQGGNTVEIAYDNGYSSSFMHIRENTITVKVGDRVTTETQVAQIGNTGSNTTGPHLHLIMRDQNNSRIDPTTVLYVYPDQTVSAKDKDVVLYYNPITYVGTPVERNPEQNQIEITLNNVNCRETPNLSGKILGYIRSGIYNYSATQENDGYTWYQVENGYWVAYSEKWAILYPANPCSQQTEELETVIKNQQAEIDNLQKQLEQAEKNPTIEINFVFTCPKTGTYAIELKENEKMYIQKS